MSENNIKGIMDTTMDKLRAMVDADTITGSPIVVGDVTLIPVSRVSFGLATGGSGDVLAGLITGLYAQNKDCLKAAVVGVFLHAFSADVLASKKSVYSIVPSDIITCVEEVLFKLSEGSLWFVQ